MKLKIKGNFIYPEISETDRTYAGAVLGPILREDGDWRDFLPPNEDQRQNGVESSACYVEAQQASIATIQEETFEVKDQNYSARFNALLSNGTDVGGDPIKGAMSIKKDGLISDELMTFKDISSWAEYHSWEGVSEVECKQKGKEWLDKWALNYKIVAEREEPIETKYISLKEALKRSPVPISVCAWYERNGQYYKPLGKRDNHLTLAIYVDEKDRIHIRDTYAPYLKILEPKTNFDFAMAWTVEKKPYEQQLNVISRLLELIGQWIGLIRPVAPIVVSVAPQPQPEPMREKILSEAKKWLGKEASPKDYAPDELACAESLCNVLDQVMDFPMMTGTWELFDHLKKDKRFKIVTELKEGNIIISPTGHGNGFIRGHVGILTGKGNIASNDSNSGFWLENYDVDSWVKRYRTRGGFPVVIFEAV